MTRRVGCTYCGGAITLERVLNAKSRGQVPKYCGRSCATKMSVRLNRQRKRAGIAMSRRPSSPAALSYDRNAVPFPLSIAATTIANYHVFLEPLAYLRDLVEVEDTVDAPSIDGTVALIERDLRLRCRIALQRLEGKRKRMTAVSVADELFAEFAQIPRDLIAATIGGQVDAFRRTETDYLKLLSNVREGVGLGVDRRLLQDARWAQRDSAARARETLAYALEAFAVPSSFDRLTGLLARTEFLRKLNRQLECAVELERGVALLCIDINGFKGVNDAVGHKGGDGILCAFADRLEQVVVRGGMLCRMGKDQFAVTAPMQRASDVTAYASHIRTAIEAPIRVSAESLLLMTAGVGAAFFPRDARTADDMLRKADEACYKSKSRDDDSRPRLTEG